LRNQCLKEVPPDSLGRGWIFVGEIDESDTVRAMQPTDLRCCPSRITVPPTGPKTALAAVRAMVWTTARGLHHGGPARSPVLVTVPILNQFPSHPIGIEVMNRCCGPSDTRDA